MREFGSPEQGVSYVFRPAAYGIFRSADGSVALVQGARGFFLPGGGAHAGETPEEALIREVREELGREAHELRALGEAVQFFIAADGAYRMEAHFFTGVLSNEQTGAGEHELIWLRPERALVSMYHECHAWAIRLVVG